MLRKIKILEASRSHMDAVIEIHRDVVSFIPPSEHYNDIWDRFASQRNVFAFVALHNGRVIGYACLLLELKIRGGSVAHIEDVVIATDMRGRGAGRSLLEHLCRVALSKGCYKVSLSASNKNAHFYERCNFSLSGHSLVRLIG